MTTPLTGTLTDANREVLDRISNDASNTAKLKNQQLDKDAFLRLMMTQLAHQDPLSPMDNEQMIAQMAQFSSVEQLGAISETVQLQLIQNDNIYNVLKDMNDGNVSPDTNTKLDSLISKTDRSNELNTEILEELRKLNAANAYE